MKTARIVRRIDTRSSQHKALDERFRANKRLRLARMGRHLKFCEIRMDPLTPAQARLHSEATGVLFVIEGKVGTKGTVMKRLPCDLFVAAIVAVEQAEKRLAKGWTLEKP